MKLYELTVLTESKRPHTERLDPSKITVTDAHPGRNKASSAWENQDERLPELRVRSPASAGPYVSVLKALIHALKYFESEYDDNDPRADHDAREQVRKLTRSFVKKFKAAPFSASGIDLKKSRTDFSGSSFMVRYGAGDVDEAITELKALVKTVTEHEQGEVDQRAKNKAEAPQRRREAAAYHAAERKTNKAKLEAKFGKKTVTRVKIRQVGGDDGYQYNVLVDGRSIVRGLSRYEAEYKRDKVLNRLAQEAKLGVYAPKCSK